MKSILDSCAMLAYVNGEPGGNLVKQILEDASNECFAHSVNLCEVHYLLARKHDPSTARTVIDGLLGIGLVERSDMSRAFWERVASHKMRAKIALADCFCLALAEELAGQVVMSDHAEFDPIVALGIYPITFIR